MAFTPGHKLSKGRPKGTVNKRTMEFRSVLEANNFCPVTAMIECYQEAKRLFDNYGTIYEAICEARLIENDKNGSYPTPLVDEGHKYLKIAGDMAKDIASYTYPKLKSIEQSKPDPLEGMTTQQRLEAMKQAVKLLEAQTKMGAQ
jgi:hypothetical protein